MTTDVVSPTGLPRRTIIKGAAWAVPAVAIASAVPTAAASAATATFAETDTSTGLLDFALLDGTGTAAANVLVTVPSEYTLTNTTGAINTTGTVTIAVAEPTGILAGIGNALSFGVASFGGVASTAGERTVTYDGDGSLIPPQADFPTTSFTRSGIPISVASNGSLSFPVVWGLAGTSTVIGAAALMSFAVTITLTLATGEIYNETSTISVPLGATFF